jgi:hypothetical protein
MRRVGLAAPSADRLWRTLIGSAGMNAFAIAAPARH